MSETVVDLTSPELYDSLRKQGPLVKVTFPGVPMPVWLIMQHDVVKTALSDPRFVRDMRNVPGHENTPSIADQIIEAYGHPPEYRDYLNGMVVQDGKDHTRLRTLVSSTFTARRINAMREHVSRITDSLLADLSSKPEVDLLEEFSFPLAGTVICQLLGVEEHNRQQMQDWIRDYASGDPAKIISSTRGMVESTKDLIRRRQAEPTDDLISGLIASQSADGDRLTETEMVTMVLLLIHTGHHTTAHFIANAVVTLLDHPDQLAQLRANPDMLPRALHELFRVASSVPLAGVMYATEDIELAGSTIRQGEAAIGSLRAANLDPGQFEDPERFDITRDPGRAEGHVTFAHGPHYCLGSALARLEGEIALNRLLVSRDTLQLAVNREDLEYRMGPGGAALVSLPVTL